MLKLLSSFLLVVLLATGCSTKNRQASAQISSEELIELISEFQTQANGDGDFATLDVESLGDGKSSIMYHAKGDSERPAASVLNMIDMSVLDPDLPALSTPQGINMTGADVVFIDTVDQDENRAFHLLIRWTEKGDSNGPHYFIESTREFQFSDKEFVATFETENNQTLVVKSRDVSPDYAEELADAIKLEIYIKEGSEEYYVGQISTMAGFGNR